MTRFPGGTGTTFFAAPDGTRLAAHRTGTTGGPPLVFLPGGPMMAAAYLGDLGGLAAHRPLVLPDPRGTGDSAAPADPDTYRCDRQVDDVEALRVHLGLERMELAAHSAGASLALLYAVRHPARIARLVLIAPSPRAAGVDVTDADRREPAERRRAEPWFPAAFAAFRRIWAGDPADDDWTAIQPFLWGRFDAAARDQLAREPQWRNDDAAARYYAPGGLDPDAVRAGLAALRAPVLLLACEHDVGLPPRRAAEYAVLFPYAEQIAQPGAVHYPWYDDPALFAAAVLRYL